MNLNPGKPRIIVALDYASAAEARRLVDKICPSDCKLKVGKEIFTREGPAFVRELVDAGFDVFLDLKFHDIPNTTARAVAAAADLGVWMVNVHASGGRRMMEAASGQLQQMGTGTLLTAVTLLTSMTEIDLREVGIPASPDEHVDRLAALARNAGLDGVVCSAREAGNLRARFGTDFLLVTPGIRPSDTGNDDDQRRTMTPKEAMEAGSSFLVVGRPVTLSPEPAATLLAISREIGDH